MKQPAMKQEVALIVGAGPGVSASCARLFSKRGMRVVMAARNPEKKALQALAAQWDVQCLACDASNEEQVQALFAQVVADHGAPSLVIHNIDGRDRQGARSTITEADAARTFNVLQGSAMSAFHVAREAARHMLAGPEPEGGHRGSIVITNASAALKGFANSAAFAMACQAKAGLAQSLARELMPQGIHVIHVPLDGAVGLRDAEGRQAHWSGIAAENDNMLDPDQVAELYCQLHHQSRSTWAFEVVLRPWQERW